MADVGAAVSSARGVSSASVSVSVSVLVLESNEGLQRLVHVWLAGRAVDHTQVLDPHHALAACAQVKYSVIFIDIDDPTTNGLAVATSIRLQGLNTSTPVIACSAREDVKDATWRDAGCSALLNKPFSKDELFRMIAQWANQQVAFATPQTDFTYSLTDLPEIDPSELIISDLQTMPKSARVLVVEDCTLTQHVICTLLKELTDNISQAFDGEQGIQMCQQNAFDIIFMDIHMPKIGGLEATFHIRNTSNLNIYTPIIAFTSSGTLEQYSAYGVNDMLQKPFTTESLANIFDKWTPFSKNQQATSMDLSILDNAGAIPAANMDQSLLSSFSIANTLPHQPTRSTTLASSPLAPRRSLGGGATSSLPSSAAAAASASSSSSSSTAALQHSHLSALQIPSTSPSASHSPQKLPHQQSSGGGAWPKKKKGNSIGHTVKEKMRRASIVASCNAFRDLVPSINDADKATVFKISVDYLAFLRTHLPAQQLEELDRKFLDQLAVKELEEQGQSLTIGAEGSRPDSPRAARRSSPAISSLTRNLSSPGYSPSPPGQSSAPY